MKPIATTRSSMNIATGKLAVWWVLVSEIVIFGGVLGSYIMNRIAHVEWGDQASHTNTWAGAFNTFVLLTSSLFAVLAHQAAEKHDGKKAALIVYSGTLDPETAVGICQHIVASVPPPLAVDETGVPADIVATRKQEAVDEAKASGKPEQIAVKMAEGKMRKFFEEVTLMGQPYVRDDKKRVKDLLPAGTKIQSFVRMNVGQH